MSSSPHVGNKKKDISILDEGPTQGLYCTALTAEKKYLIIFTKIRKKFCLSFHYNGANSYLFVNGAKFSVFNLSEIIKFKAKDFEIAAVP